MDWHRVARTVQELGQQGCGGLALWDFLDFVVTYPTPVFVLLLPFIEQHVRRALVLVFNLLPFIVKYAGDFYAESPN